MLLVVLFACLFCLSVCLLNKQTSSRLKAKARTVALILPAPTLAPAPGQRMGGHPWGQRSGQNATAAVRAVSMQLDLLLKEGTSDPASPRMLDRPGVVARWTKYVENVLPFSKRPFKPKSLMLPASREPL
jgi:hypothetical protein